MPTLVLRPFLLRLLSPSSSPSTSPGSSSPCHRLSVSSTRAQILERFTTAAGAMLRASIHPSCAGYINRFRDGGGLATCGLKVHTVKHNYCHVESPCNGRRSHAMLPDRGQELLVEEEWEGLEKWARGGGVVHKLAQVDASAVIEMGAVIHAHAIVGANTRISSGSIVGSHVIIGSQSKLGFNVALQNCSVGNFCILHSGVCIGQDGFGFTVNEIGEVVKKPQMLKVQIGNNVEIGANSCIDRGSWRDTIIGDHTKIDNLVQIGHNVVIGRCCMLCGQVGLAGSSTLGDYVVMGGKAGVADHVSVTSKVRIAAKSAVMSHIVEPGDYAGFPAVPAKQWRRSVVNFRKLGKQPRM